MDQTISLLNACFSSQYPSSVHSSQKSLNLPDSIVSSKCVVKNPQFRLHRQVFYKYSAENKIPGPKFPDEFIQNTVKKTSRIGEKAFLTVISKVLLLKRRLGNKLKIFWIFPNFLRTYVLIKTVSKCKFRDSEMKYFNQDCLKFLLLC